LLEEILILLKIYSNLIQNSAHLLFYDSIPVLYYF